MFGYAREVWLIFTLEGQDATGVAEDAAILFDLVASIDFSLGQAIELEVTVCGGQSDH